jgi:hypothetical protein
MIDISFGEEKKSNRIDDLIAESRELIVNLSVKKAVEYLRPFKAVFYREYLSLATEQACRYLEDWYDCNEVYPHESLIGPTVLAIMHGHELGVGCSSPTFCHQYGYKPTGSEHPAFIKLFYQKWPNLR